jgi:hypothetical protein
MILAFDVFSLLSRKGDKCSLGNGTGLIYAPSFPEYLDVPGFYDYADYFDVKVEPIFTVTILDEDLKPLRLDYDGTSLLWNPAYIRQRYFCSRGIEVIEWKTVSQNSALTSTLEIMANKGSRTSQDLRFLHIVPWVAYPPGTILDLKPVENKTIVLVRKNPTVVQAMGSRLPFSSFTANLSQGSENKPRWELAPFGDKIWGGSFKNEIKREVGTDPYGLLYIGLHYPLKLTAEGKTVFSMSTSISDSEEDALAKVRTEVQSNPTESSTRSWNDFFSQVPEFHCSDPFIEKYYWYRWYGLHLMTVEKRGNHKYPCVYEGLRVFRRHISYSAQTQVLETRWMKDPTLAQGCILGLFYHQKPNGFLPGIVGSSTLMEKTFYHANWGRAVTELYKVHPNLDFLRGVYEPLTKYLNYFDTERDCDHDHLYDIIDQYESGQELNPRYLYVDSEADRDKPLEEPLEGVDASVYIYELQNALSYIAQKLGKKDDQEKFKQQAKETKKAIQTMMWDERDNMFYDLRPSDHWYTRVKAITCFYPFICDIPLSKQLRAIKEHLLNEKQFWTPFPVATLSMDDEYFSTCAEWKGKRMMCPWNGRVWPMTNSHIAEALIYTAESTRDESLRMKAADFIRKYVKMMFFDGDVERPNCFEHYNPITGTPSDYRGIDDYQHSWVADLIIKYVCGIRPADPSEKLLVVDPLPFNLGSFSIENVSYQGHKVKVTWAAKSGDKHEPGLNVYVDEKRAASSNKLERLVINLE